MATVYLIPSLLAEEGLDAINTYAIDAIKKCTVFFVENERTTRRYFKQVWKDMVIDNYEWHTIDNNAAAIFKSRLKDDTIIGIVSDAGCPGVADPGQFLVGIAQEMNATIKPLVGPNSILLALMASGMNGQRNKAIKDLELDSQKRDSTQIFIETPYRNNQLIEALVKNCNPATRLCIAVDITGKNEWIKTKTLGEWQKEKIDIHKRPAIFLLYAK